MMGGGHSDQLGTIEQASFPVFFKHGSNRNKKNWLDKTFGNTPFSE